MIVTNTTSIDSSRAFQPDDVVYLGELIKTILSNYVDGNHISISIKIDNPGKGFRFSSIEEFQSNFRWTSEIKLFSLYFRYGTFFDTDKDNFFYMVSIGNEPTRKTTKITIECANELVSDKIMEDIKTNSDFIALLCGDSPDQQEETHLSQS